MRVQGLVGLVAFEEDEGPVRLSCQEGVVGQRIEAARPRDEGIEVARCMQTLRERHEDAPAGLGVVPGAMGLDELHVEVRCQRPQLQVGELRPVLTAGEVLLRDVVGVHLDHAVRPGQPRPRELRGQESVVEGQILCDHDARAVEERTDLSCTLLEGRFAGQILVLDLGDAHRLRGEGRARVEEVLVTLAGEHGELGAQLHLDGSELDDTVAVFRREARGLRVESEEGEVGPTHAHPVTCGPTE